MPRPILLILGGLTAFVVLAACGADSETIDAAAPDETVDDAGVDETSVDEMPRAAIDVDVLEGSTWTLRAGGGSAGEIPIVDGWPLTIVFDGTNLGGTAACNGYGGTYTIDGHQLMIDGIGQTQAACEPDVLASESAYLTALLDVDAIELAGDAEGGYELALSGAATELLFRAEAPVPNEIQSRTWLLEALVRDGEAIGVAGQPAMLMIETDGSFTGSTGCRTLSGRYVEFGAELVFNEMAADGECPTALRDQDNHVIGVLEGGFVAEIEGDNLILTSAGNEGLRYRRSSPDEVASLDGVHAPSDAEALAGIEWIFVGGDSPDGPIADPRTFDSDAVITLIFGPGIYQGQAVCNAYGGSADIGESLWTFSLGPAEANQEGCGDPFGGPDGPVERYLSALPHMREGGIEGDGQRLVMNGN
ncbi:MAG: META domain-containing protein, partial [Actinomycetota bacterium]